MALIIVDPETSKKLMVADRIAEICDPSGKVLGQFIPATDHCQYDLTEPPISEEELRAIEADPVSYTTAEVLEHLRRL